MIKNNAYVWTDLGVLGRASMNSHAAARRRSPVKVSEHIEGDGATNRAPRLRSLDRQQARRCAGEARGLAGR